MKTLTTFRFILALALGLALPAAAQEEGPDCSRWGFKQLALGMSVAKVKEHYSAAAPDKRKPEAAAVGGHAYRWQHRDESQLIDFQVIADEASPDGTVVQIRAKLRGGGIPPADWHKALLEKWGGIAEIRRDEPSAGMTTIEGRSFDEACDARVEFRGTGNAEEMTLDITLFSLAASREWDRQQLEESDSNKARQLLE